MYLIFFVLLSLYAYAANESATSKFPITVTSKFLLNSTPSFAIFAVKVAVLVSSLLVTLPSLVTTVSSDVDQVTPSCDGSVISAVTAVKSPKSSEFKGFS